MKFFHKVSTAEQFEIDRMALIEQIVRQQTHHNVPYEDVVDAVRIVYGKEI